MPVNQFRSFLVFEFLVALVATYTVWSQVGGQGHLDMMPWYSKMLCGFGLAGAVVGFTAGAAREKFWNRHSVAWLLVVLGVALAMGALTYRYHLLEPAEDEYDESMTKAHCSLAQSV
jgi:hypothetical protein